MKYGETLGVTTGRLMLKSEAEALQTVNRDILFNNNISGYVDDFFLGTADVTYWENGVYFVNTVMDIVESNGCNFFMDLLFCGLRPVVEILKSNIS